MEDGGVASMPGAVEDVSLPPAPGSGSNPDRTAPREVRRNGTRAMRAPSAKFSGSAWAWHLAGASGVPAQTVSVSNPVRLRVSGLNSTATKWIGSPRARYLSA